MYKTLFYIIIGLFGSYAFAQNDTLNIQKIMDEAYSLEQSHPVKALQLYQKTYKQSLNLNYKDGAYKSLLYSGLVHSNEGKYDSATYFYNKCIAYSKKSKLPVGVAKGYVNMANMYQYKGDYSKAVKYYLTSIKIFEKENDSIATSQSYQNLSAIYTQFKNEKLEFYYLKKAEQYLPKSNFDRLGLLYGDIGLGLLNQNKLSEALLYFEKASALTKKSNSGELTFYVSRNFGDYYLFKNEFNKSITFYEKALMIADTAVNVVTKNDLIYILSDVHLSTKNYAKALDYANSSLKLAKETGSDDLAYKSLKRISDIYHKLNQPLKAYQFLEKSYRLKDSAFTKEQLIQISLLQTQFETEKKDKAIAEQKVKLNKNEVQMLLKEKQMGLYAIVISILVLLSLGIWLFFHQRQRIKNKEIQSLKQRQEIAQLEALIDGEEKERRRIAQELHDGINGDLSAIKYRISSLEEYGFGPEEKADLKKIIEMIDYSCSQVRNISHNLMPASIVDFGLVETVSEYCSKINSSNTLTIDFQSFGNQTNLPKKAETVIYRIIQELINNIVKHAQATSALVQFNFHVNEMFITVEDNGIGFDTKSVKNGLGLKNINSRVNYLNAQLEINSSDKGTSFHITIDLKMLKND